VQFAKTRNIRSCRPLLSKAGLISSCYGMRTEPPGVNLGEFGSDKK
jgi:hypothetical protein